MTDTPKPPSTNKVVLRITLIIAVIELLIMLTLRSLPHTLGTFTEAIVDTLALTALSSPAIFVWVIRPYVLARDAALSELAHIASHDPLTQLANRRLLLEHLEKCLAGLRRRNTCGALLLIDLDGFKAINDLHGHNSGDAVLVETARRLSGAIRAEDSAGRLGGDEFMVLLSHLDADPVRATHAARRVAERILHALGQPCRYRETTLQIAASIGVYVLDRDSPHAEEAIARADAAMYQAKQAGKNRIVVGTL